MSAHHVPEIPGYRVLRQLGRGGMASVYLAMQESVEREVALKIMAPQLSADPTFGERFLREARIAAKLHHRHVVSIYDVGVHNGFHYCTMEYLPGGTVMRKGSPPLALKPALRCIREIAQALNYAHSKGFVHRDVKPDNILLREDGSCVLGDFGIARAAESGTMMTKTGSVVGTPHYMSPEQLRGRAIDGRADLYSLGVVFFQLVTGKVPYEASDSLAVGIMHMTAPLPQLPRDYRLLQPILDKMLAKEPADRYQTGAEIEAAIAEAEKAIASGRTEPLTQPLPARPVAAERPQRSGYDTQGSLRTEPQIGHMERFEEAGLRAEPRHQTQFSRAHQSRPARTGLWWVLGAALVLSGLAWWQRPLISAQLIAWLTPAANPGLDAADRALAEGRLFTDGGDDAVSLFLAALLVDGDDQRARAGLDSTLDRLHPELKANPDAERIAALTRKLTGAPGYATRIERFRELLPSASGSNPPAQADTSDLALAQRAESEGRLGGADGALARFAAAYAAQPGNEAARQGVERVAAAVVGQARSQLAAGNLAAAEQLQRELAVVPAAAGLATKLAAEIAARRVPDTSARLAEILVQAERLARAGKLVDPRNGSAADRYREALALAPDDAAARQGLARAAASALSQIDAAIEGKDFKRAQDLRKRIQELAPRTPGLTELKERIEDAEAAAKAASPERVAAHDKLVREGELALSSGQLMEPTGDSAYDKFRQALALNPRSESARAGMRALAQALKLEIEESITAGRATRADGGIAALETVDPRFDTGALKTRVAHVYAENGLRSLQGGSVEQAREDLAGAERLDPAEASVIRLREALVGR
ncbi:MAG: serine/threonine protein kinase [Rhodanobacteraceae bacterium]|nr:serine/threonine protein kinase [Rhodanobacteraceae bacterium]